MRRMPNPKTTVAPWLSPSGCFLRKRQTHLKGKSSASQSDLLRYGASSQHRNAVQAAGIGEKEMRATAVKQARIADIVIPIATLAVVGIAAMQSAVADHVLALLHDGFAFFSFLNIGSGFSPAPVGVIALVLFLAGAVRGL